MKKVIISRQFKLFAWIFIEKPTRDGFVITKNLDGVTVADQMGPLYVIYSGKLNLVPKCCYN